MRKIGIVPFVIYLIYFLGGGGMAIYNYIAIQKHNAEGGGLEGLGLAILFIIGIIFGAAGLVGVILKGIHMGTGWGFFGFLCFLLDIAFIVVFISMVLPGGNNVDAATIEDILPVIPFISGSVIAGICNVASMRRI